MGESSDIKKILNRRNVYLVVLICLAITAFLYWREMTTTTSPLNRLSWNGNAFIFLFIALIMMIFRDLAYIIRIRILTDYKLSWRQGFNVIMIWEFASALSPGVVGGSAVALFILKKEKIPIGKSTALVIITLILDNLFYILLIPIVFLVVDIQALFPPDVNWMDEGLSMFWIAYGIILSINIVLVLSVFYSPGIIHGIVRLIYRLPFLKKRASKAEEFSRDIEVASKELSGKSFGYWLKLFGSTIWSWTARFLVINFVLLAFIELGLIDQFIILARQLFLWLLMLITPTPGGSGMAEYAFSSIFIDYIGPAGLSAASLALIWRTISYYPYLILGSIILPRWLNR